MRAARTQDVVSSTTTSRDNKNRQNTSGAGAGVVQKFLSRQHLAKDFTKQLKISESYWNGMKRGGGGQGKAKTVEERCLRRASHARREGRSISNACDGNPSSFYQVRRMHPSDIQGI